MSLTVVAPLGPNPAALTELIWHLVSVEGHTVDAVWVVIESARARGHLRAEILAAGRAWDDLRRRCGDGVPVVDRVYVVEAPGAHGLLPADEHAPELTDTLKEPLWRAARAAQRAAEVTVFALSGGRRRASTALQATTFQLLARRGDRLVDVRVSDPRAEGGSGFYFPRQAHQDLVGVREHHGKPFLASAVEVLVDPVEVPKLRDLLDEEALRTFAAAFSASEARIREAAPPLVVLDLALGRVFVDGIDLKLSPDRFALYGAVLLCTARGERMRSADLGPLREVIATGKGALGWAARIKGEALAGVRDGRLDDADLLQDLSGLHCKLSDHLETWCRKHRPRAASFVVPWSRRVHEKEGDHFVRVVDLPSDRIDVVGQR